MKKKYLIEILLEGEFQVKDENKVIEAAADIETALADKLFDCPGNLKIAGSWIEEGE